MPTLCVISETIGEENAIGKVAMAQVRIALESGFKVSVVAKQLCSSLQQDVEWLRLTVPPRIFLLKWVTARAFIKAAIGGRRFDLIHAHQPQAASLSDVFTCHFLTRVAFERNALDAWHPLRSGVARLQQQAVLQVEDRFYQQWNPRTQMLFCSDLLRSEFNRLYGPPRHAAVMINPSPPENPITSEQRRLARQRFLGSDNTSTVIGYLGGFQERKGFRRLIKAAKGIPSTILLIGGPRSDSTNSLKIGGARIAGFIDNVDEFYAACDVVAVPSLFDPCPLVVLEAAARRIPIIATDGVGNLPQLLQYGAGLRWDGVSPLAPLVSAVQNGREAFQTGAKLMTSSLSTVNHARGLRQVYQNVLIRKSGEPGAGKPSRYNSRAVSC